MIFTDLWFFPFFIVVLIVSNIILKDKQKARSFFLLAASYFFYASWNWKLAFLIIISTSSDYYCALQIPKAFKVNNIKKAKLFLLISLILNLSILAFFKYFNLPM